MWKATGNNSDGLRKLSAAVGRMPPPPCVGCAHYMQCADVNAPMACEQFYNYVECKAIIPNATQQPTQTLFSRVFTGDLKNSPLRTRLKLGSGVREHVASSNESALAISARTNIPLLTVQRVRRESRTAANSL